MVISFQGLEMQETVYTALNKHIACGVEKGLARMSNKIKVMTIFGVRPEAIKMAPLILELQKHPESIESIVCVTAQHRQMLDQVLEVFKVLQVRLNALDKLTCHLHIVRHGWLIYCLMDLELLLQDNDANYEVTPEDQAILVNLLEAAQTEDPKDSARSLEKKWKDTKSI